MTALLGAASLATAAAQTVYSVNAVGYVNVTVPAGGFALLANPLNLPTNDIPSVLPDAPANTVVYVYDAASSGFLVATKRASGSWTGNGATATLDPGKGFFIKNAGTAAMNITFVGEVMQGNLSLNYVSGFNLIGSLVPQTGKLETDLGYKATANDVVYLFDPTTQAYPATYTKRSSGAWTGGSGEPSIPVANGFWLKAAAAGSWTRSFSVNQ